MPCEPAVKDLLSLAIPAASSATTPSTVEPSLNVTLPVGVPEEPDGVTFAVNVTDCPAEAGFRLDTTDVVVAAVSAGAALTVCVSGADVLPADRASPAYPAVIA